MTNSKNSAQFSSGLSARILNTAGFVDYEYITKMNLSFHKISEEMGVLRSHMSQKWARDEYIDWVSQWKALYRVITRTSQILKHYRKPSNILAKNKSIKVEVASEMAFNRNNERIALRRIATAMIELRKEGKEMAQVSYLYHKAAT